MQAPDIARENLEHVHVWPVAKPGPPKGNGKRMQDQRRTKEREFADLNKDFQRKQREFREDLNQRRNEELAAVLERANRAIKSIAEAEKYDIIFQEAVYANPRIDLTDKVIKALEDKPAGK